MTDKKKFSSEKSIGPRLPSFLKLHWGIFSLLGLISLLSLCIFQDYILLQKLYLFKDNGADSLAVYYPRWIHIVDYLKEYGIPMWSFNCGMGENIFPAEINDPFSFLLYLFGHRLAYGIIYIELLKFFTAGIISFFYLKTIGLEKYSCLIGSLMLVFSGYMMAGSSGWYGHSSLLVYGIFWLLAFEQLLVKKNIFLFPIAVILLSTASLFYIFIFTVFLFLYSLMRFIVEKGWCGKEYAVLLLKMAGLGLLGLCMNAAFLVSPLFNMLNSPRVGGESGYFNQLVTHPMFGFAQPLEYLTVYLRCFASDILGTGLKLYRDVNGAADVFVSYQGWGNYFEGPLFYCSLPVLLLISQIFIFLNKRQKVIYSIFLFVWLFMLIFPFFRYSLYLFSGDYYKGGLNFFIPLIFIFTAMQALNKVDTENKINLRVLITTAIILLASFNLLSLSFGKDIVNQKLQIFASVLLIFYTFLIYLMSISKYKDAAKVAFLIILCFEIIFLSNSTINDRAALSTREFESKIGYNDYTKDALAYIRSIDKGFYRVQKDYVSAPTVYINLNDSQVQNYYGTTSYNSFNQRYYISFLGSTGLIDPANEILTRWSPGLMYSPVLQSFASVKYGLSKSKENYFTQYGYRLVHRVGDILIYQNQFWLPLGFAYDQYMLQIEYSKLDDKQKATSLLKVFIIPETEALNFSSLHAIKAENIPPRYAIAEYDKDVRQRRQHGVELTGFKPNKITGKISLPDTQLVLFSIPFDKGWTAEVDGRQTDIQLVDSGLMGLIINPGTHDIELKYCPPLLFIGIVISIIGFLVFLILVAYKLRAFLGEQGKDKKEEMINPFISVIRRYFFFTKSIHKDHL